jgi:hypothetical protein
MHVITVTGHEPGDYVHPDQKVKIVDEPTGQEFELIVRSNAMTSTGAAEISLFIPTAAIRGLVTDKEYCVLTLSESQSESEKQERRDRLIGLCAQMTPAKSRPSSTLNKKRSKR